MQRPTTAQQLCQYYRELIAGGIPHDTAHELVLEASRELIGLEGVIILKTASGEAIRIAEEPSEGVGESKSPA